MFKRPSQFLIVLALLFFQYNLYSQPLTGIKTIPGDYATIAAAIFDVDLLGVGAGGVTFNVAAGYTETFLSPTAGIFLGTGTEANPVVFKKSGTGANPVITAAAGVGTFDGIIIFAGSDYVTFDGIDLQENILNIDPTTRMEWGYALLKHERAAPSNGCQHVTIKNSTISLSSDNGIGIYSAHRAYDGTVVNIDTLVSSPLDATSYTKIYNNTISSVVSGLIFTGSSRASFYDLYNEIGVDGANHVTNFGKSGSAAYGLHIEYNNFGKVANNLIDGSMTGSTLYGIRTGSATGGTMDVYNNTISVAANGTSFYSITNSAGSATGGIVKIYNNVIENCTYSGTNSWWAIYHLSSSSDVNIYGNIVRNNIDNVTSSPFHGINSGSVSASNVKIYDNQIYGNTANAIINGIIIGQAGGSIDVYRNKIYDLTSNSSGTSACVFGISLTSGATIGNIYNNFVSDLKAPISSAADAIRGINVASTTSNSNMGVYYNTVFLNAASSGGNFGTAGIYHQGSTTATTAVLDLRNNTVVNLSVPVGTGKTASYRRSSTSLANYNLLSNNNAFYSGTPSATNVIFYDGTNFDETMPDYKIRMNPREGSSVTENVPFVNKTTAPYDLHVRTDVGTQTEGGGQSVSTPIVILDDFDGNTRHLTKPDIGADEFAGLTVDITPPFINYTALVPTLSTANRTLSDVIITDGSNINITPGTAPRIYFKKTTNNNTFVDNTSGTNGWKYVQSTTGSSPFEFTINYSLLFGGVSGGDIIQYFVVAQDLATPANVAMFSGDFTTPPTSVNLTAAAFPVTGTVNSYLIQYYMNGTVSVGTGNAINSLTGPTGLFKSISENPLSGNVIALVTSDLTETGEYALSEWIESGAGGYTVTIKSDAPVLRRISGTYAGGLVRISGADRVTIDGSYNNSGNYLEFQNMQLTGNAAAIQAASLGAGLGVNNLTIQNCIIKGGINSVTTMHALYIGGTSLSTSGSGADNNNITIKNNIIQQSSFGIYARGTSTNPMLNLLITGNRVGSDILDETVQQYGMNIGAAVAPVITGNEVFNMNYDISKWGIYFGTYITNALVSKNKVHSISQPGTTGYNSVGIYFSSGTGCSDNQIDNNIIYDLNTYGATSTNPFYLSGIRIAGGTNYKVYYNSVNISGAFATPSAGIYSACLYVSNTASTNLDIRNNIFSNTRTGITPKSYAIYIYSGSSIANINYNDYYSTSSVIGYFVSDAADLAAWKALTGQDVNSISGNPLFVSDVNLHITNMTSPAAHAAITISGLTTDFDGDLRQATPDMGADEFSQSGSTTFQLTVNVTDSWNMVSVPGIITPNMHVDTWWSGRNPLASVYKWTGTYAAVTVTSPREGYWMLHNGPKTYNTGDEWPAGGIQIVAHDPIPVTTGWNMIGGYDGTPLVSALTTTPPGLIVPGTVYGWSGSYSNATNLNPGYGYWVLINAPGGVINIPSSSAKGVLAKEDNKESWGKITLTDASGKSFTLYSVNGEVNLDSYQMPPLPPTGAFDVRYSSGRRAEDLSKANQTIEMAGIQYPVRVSVENTTIRIQDGTAKGLNTILKAGESVSISRSEINKLLVSGNVVPVEYSLGQNYPNPFNPSTLIQFSLPEDVNNVTLTVYDGLGQKVAELVNGSMQAGYHQYQWNASNLASGLYIYQLRTEKFVSTKKMMFMK